MSNVPEQLKYCKSHEWIKHAEGNTFIVGISDHAQALLGDLVYVELPEIGREVTEGEECCVVESVKAASDVYSPVAGTVVEINENLLDNPEQVNQEPYENGWLFKLTVADTTQLDNLLDSKDYKEMITEDA
jgi:glycine cleavage system H protein